MSDYLKVEKAREVRLWIGQIVIPAVLGGIAVLSNPQARSWCSDKFDIAKSKIANIFHK